MPFATLDELVSRIDLELAMNNRVLEGRLSSISQSRMLIDRMNEAVSVLKKKPTDGPLLYDVIFQTYMSKDIPENAYSDCTIRITYKATMHSDDSVVYGDSGNPNEVVLLWKRSSQDYYDTLVDDAHVYTYAMELTKLFSDGNGNFENVEFIMQNDSDGYFVKAELNEEEGIYYVVDHVENEADATHFVPVIPQAVNPRQLVEYKVIVKGLEDDNYTVTEVRTDDGYTLLKDDIKIVISQVETTELCDIYASDVLGLVQNDPRYATIINDTGDLKNMP